MLQLGDVTIGYEPPRPTISPKRREQVFRPGVGENLAYLEDWGLVGVRPIRFVSSPSQGFLTASQASSLITLYESGLGFALVTDLLGPLGSPTVTYSARFDTATVPMFTPADPAGDYYYFDMLLLVS